MSDSGGNGATSPHDLTQAVSAVKRGLRSDVRAFMDALDGGELFAPLAAKVKGAIYGEQIQVEDELRLTPHMLEDRDGKLYCALFTRPEFIEPVEEQLGWLTDGEPLEYCAIPARAAFDMALEAMNDEDVLGLVLNAMDETELVLQRSELASIVQNQAIPLVGYVQDIPDHADDNTLLAEPADPPPPELVSALEAAIGQLPEVQSYKLQRTFNAERDLEPHLTLRLQLTDQADRDALAERIIRQIEDKLPPPGYIDVLFDED